MSSGDSIYKTKKGAKYYINENRLILSLVIELPK